MKSKKRQVNFNSPNSEKKGWGAGAEMKSEIKVGRGYIQLNKQMPTCMHLMFRCHCQVVLWRLCSTINPELHSIA